MKGEKKKESLVLYPSELKLTLWSMLGLADLVPEGDLCWSSWGEICSIGSQSDLP